MSKTKRTPSSKDERNQTNQTTKLNNKPNSSPIDGRRYKFVDNGEVTATLDEKGWLETVDGGTSWYWWDLLADMGYDTSSDDPLSQLSEVYGTALDLTALDDIATGKTRIVPPSDKEAKDVLAAWGTRHRRTTDKEPKDPPPPVKLSKRPEPVAHEVKALLSGTLPRYSGLELIDAVRVQASQLVDELTTSVNLTDRDQRDPLGGILSATKLDVPGSVAAVIRVHDTLTAIDDTAIQLLGKDNTPIPRLFAKLCRKAASELLIAALLSDEDLTV